MTSPIVGSLDDNLNCGYVMFGALFWFQKVTPTATTTVGLLSSGLNT
jgi:hypothetical protein